MTTLHRDDVDGVPTFWVDTGRPTLYAALMVRAGIADETLPTTGWLHLAEHLALHDRERGTLRVDGSVSLRTTRLAAQGDPADVAATMTAICDWLADPVLDRVAEESRVLRAESEYRGTGDAATAMLQRFGARGPGWPATPSPVWRAPPPTASATSSPVLHHRQRGAGARRPAAGRAAPAPARRRPGAAARRPGPTTRGRRPT